MSEHSHNLLAEQQIPSTAVAPRFGGQIGTEIEAREQPGPLRQLVSTVTPVEILPPAPQAPHRLRKLLLVGASVLALVGGAHFGWDYWQHC